MQVEVVRLRSRGFKIDSEALKRVRPIKGHILMWDYFDPYKRKRVSVVALLANSSPGSSHLIPRLEGVRLTRWNSKGMVLVGMEQIDSRRDTREHKQAWWVRVIERPAEAPQRA